MNVLLSPSAKKFADVAGDSGPGVTGATARVGASSVRASSGETGRTGIGPGSTSSFAPEGPGSATMSAQRVTARRCATPGTPRKTRGDRVGCALDEEPASQSPAAAAQVAAATPKARLR